MALGALSSSFLTQVSAGVEGAGAVVPLRRLSLSLDLVLLSLSLSLDLALPGGASGGGGEDGGAGEDGAGAWQYRRMSSTRSRSLAQRLKLICGRWSTTTVGLVRT